MQQLSNLDYHYLVEELQELVGSRLSKIYQYDSSFRFKFNKQGTEYNLLVAPGKRAHLTKYIEETPPEPPSFTISLRKILENALVTSVEHVNFDRLFSMKLKKSDAYSLYFEMFGGGNIVLCKENSILLVFERAEYSSRKLAPKQEYSAPPSAKKHPSSITPADLAGLKGKIVSSLSRIVNLSPFYLEEACARAGVPLEKDASQLGDSEAVKLCKSLASLAKEKSPVIYYDNGKPTYYAPFHLKKIPSSLEAVEFDSFNKALDEYYYNQQKQVGESDRLKKLKFSLQQQETALKEFGENETQARRKAERIYEKYAEAEETIESAKKKGKREKFTVDL